MSQSNYTYRGFMLDTARQWFPVSSIKQILDYMNEANLNKFHMHLTDNEGFNVEWDYDYQKLTKYTSLKGKYYTKNDLKEIIEYANQYNIEVIPEFDFPGHIKAWGQVYPELLLTGTNDEFDMDNRKVREMLDHLYNEFIPIFDNTNYLHMGHDEVSASPESVIDSITYAAHTANIYKKTPIIWNDAITDKGIRQPPCKPFNIQVWNNQQALDTILDLEYKTIISLSDYFYIGGSKSPKEYIFPKNENIIGFEVVWFTSESDDPNDISWIRDILMETKDF